MYKESSFGRTPTKQFNPMYEHIPSLGKTWSSSVRSGEPSLYHTRDTFSLEIINLERNMGAVNQIFLD